VSKVLAEPAFIGRERELEELTLQLDSALEGKGRTAFVSGEAGSGKSRLTREFLSTAKQKGVGTMAGWCLGDSQVPYFPFMEAFNNYYSASGEGETILLQPQAQLGLGIPAQVGFGSGELEITSWLSGSRLAEKTERLQALSPQVWKDQVFAAVSKTLHTIAAVQSPVVLFIEDVHWADSASLALLHYISRAIHDSERVLLLATFRSEELTADAEGHPHPLAETLRLMRREELFTEVKLSSLSQENVSRIAKNMIGGALQSKLAEKLTNESKGNPLFVVESLRMLHERKSLIQENDEWRLAIDELGIPSKIKDIILRRLSCLKYAQRRVLDAASVIGEKFDVDLLSAVLGQDSLEVLETLNVIAQSTSLVCAEGTFYSFDHAKFQEALYDEVPTPLKRGYHARIAEKLEQTSKVGKPLPLADLAHHYAEAGNTEKALYYAMEAGKDALKKSSNAQAIKHFTCALHSVGTDPERRKEQAAALLGLGDAYAQSGLSLKALQTFEQLIENTSGAEKFQAILRAAYATFLHGDVIRLAKLLDQAQEYVGSDRLGMAHIFGLRATLGGLKGDVNYADEYGEKATQILEEEYMLQEMPRALKGGFGRALHGKLETAVAEGLLCIAICDDLKDFRTQLENYNMVGQTFGLCGLFPEEEQMFKKGLQIEDELKLGSLRDLSQIYQNWSIILHIQGKLEESLTKALKAIEIAEKTDSAFAQGIAYASTTVEYVFLNNMAEADKYFQKLVNLPPQTLESGWVGLNNVKAIYYAAKGQMRQAIQCANEYVASAKSYRLSPNEPGSPLVEANINLVNSRMHTALGKEDEAQEDRDEAFKILKDAQKRFEHVNLRPNLMTLARVKVDQTFDARLDLINVSRAYGTLVTIKGMLPKYLEVIKTPPDCAIEGAELRLKETKFEPYSVKTITLTFKATEQCTINLNPQIVYIDDLDQTKTCRPRPITIIASPVDLTYEILPGRISTGSAELDKPLLGGIPEKYAVILVSPSCNEKELIVKNFLETGTERGEVTFFVTTEAGKMKDLAESHRPNFFLFVCNPQADAMVPNLPNIYKLKSIENLTEIDIALDRAFKTLNQVSTNTRRICLDIVSDALLQHHAVTTRRWLSALLPTLKSKGFTIFAIIDPLISPREVPAINGLFDGEIEITEKGLAKTLRVKKLSNQKYLEIELALTREKLEQ